MAKSVVVPSLARYNRDREVDPLNYYIPHPGQLPFHCSTAKIRAMFGGNRSGKTEAGAAETGFYSKQSQEYRSRPIRKDVKILVGSESNEYNRDIIVPKLRKWIPKSHIIKEVRIQRGFVDFWQLSNGGIIKFKNYEQEADKWAGDDYDLIWLDEQPPHDIWKECLLRIIDRDGGILLTMTPIKGMTWVYPEVWENNGVGGIECFLMDMDINPHLSQAAKDVVLANLTEQEKKIRKEGKFVALHGLVYPQFNESKHVIEPFEIPREWKTTVIAVDPHLKKPTAVLWGVIADYDYKDVSRGDWIIWKELLYTGMIPDIVTAIMVANGQHRIFARIGDPALNFKENITGVSPFDEFAVCGFPLIPANKKVESGIYAIRKLLDQTPSGIRIFNTCISLIWEFRHYSFNDVESDMEKPYSEKIRKRDDDLLDDLRYMINTGFKVSSRRPPGEYVYSETGRLMGIRK